MLASEVLTEEWLADVLQDSLDMGWTSTDGARAIMKALEAGLIVLPQAGGQIAALSTASPPRSLETADVDQVARIISLAKAQPEHGQTSIGAWWWDERHDRAKPEHFEGECREEDRAHARQMIPLLLAALRHPQPSTPVADAGMVERYRQALQDVCNPLGYLRRLAEAEGAKLGGMAHAIANDIATVQRIARDALAAAPDAEGER